MQSDHKGCSTCPPGEERVEEFNNVNGRTCVQYDYRAPEGELFSCLSGTLDEARQRRDLWRARERTVANKLKAGCHVCRKPFDAETAVVATGVLVCPNCYYKHNLTT